MAYLLGFNNNIRCIEIDTDFQGNNGAPMFNNNIRCIEITSNISQNTFNIKFNNNIRCIEINILVEHGQHGARLITT